MLLVHPITTLAERINLYLQEILGDPAVSCRLCLRHEDFAKYE